MVNKNTLYGGCYYPTHGIFILATASKSIFSAYPDDVQFDFYVGIKGGDKLYCFLSFIDGNYSLNDGDGIHGLFNDYLNSEEVLTAAIKASDEHL